MSDTKDTSPGTSRRTSSSSGDPLLPSLNWSTSSPPTLQSTDDDDETIQSSSSPVIGEPTRDISTQTDLSDEEFGPRPVATDETAQHIYPPEACIFAANLPKDWTDLEIKGELQTIFSEYGAVFVKVRRDPSGLPVSFVQFTSVLDCGVAFADAGNHYLGQRVIRLEMAKCDRQLLCTGRHGLRIKTQHIDEIKALASSFGPVESVTMSSSVDDISGYHRPALLVNFRHYGTCQDAFRQLHGHEHWIFSLSNSAALHFGTSPNMSEPQVSHIPSMDHRPQRPRKEYAVFASLIIIHGLPGNISPQSIKNVFQRFGTIVKIKTYPKPVRIGVGPAAIRSCTVSFAEQAAGPLTWAYSAHFGIALADDLGQQWSTISVQVAEIGGHRVQWALSTDPSVQGPIASQMWSALGKQVQQARYSGHGYVLGEQAHRKDNRASLPQTPSVMSPTFHEASGGASIDGAYLR